VSKLDTPAGWSVTPHGSLQVALVKALARMDEASNRMANMEGQRRLQDAMEIVRAIKRWADDHAITHPLYVPQSNKSQWE
jgi:hypothetical protein